MPVLACAVAVTLGASGRIYGWEIAHTGGEDVTEAVNGKNARAERVEYLVPVWEKSTSHWSPDSLRRSRLSKDINLLLFSDAVLLTTANGAVIQRKEELL